MTKTYAVVNESFHHGGTLLVQGNEFTIKDPAEFHRFDHLVTIGNLKLVSEEEDPAPVAEEAAPEEVAPEEVAAAAPIPDEESVHQADGFSHHEDAKEHDDE